MNSEGLLSIFFHDFNSDEWDKITNHFDITINYTSWFFSYIETLNTETKIRNFTFLICKNDNPIAIVPLYIESINNAWQISMGQEPIYAPILSKNFKINEKPEIFKFILEKVNNLANEYNCILARFHHSPLLKDQSNIDYYKEFGYIEDILYPDWYIFKCKFSYLINLENDKKTLFSRIRKGHKSNINKSQKVLNLLVLDKHSFSQDLFNRYVIFYFQIKGERRNPKAFKLDSNAVKSGLQTIMICEYDNELIGAIALHTFNYRARYNSSVIKHGIVKGIYPNHFLLWSAILYLKDKKFKLFEIGEQVVESELYKVNTKEKNLSHFKAGWGASLVPWPKVQKNYY